MIDEKIRQRAKKLHALAERGVGGEKTNAQTMLDAFLVKHNLRMVDISTKPKREMSMAEQYPDEFAKFEKLVREHYNSKYKTYRPPPKKKWWLKRFLDWCIRKLFPPL